MGKNDVESGDLLTASLKVLTLTHHIRSMANNVNIVSPLSGHLKAAQQNKRHYYDEFHRLKSHAPAYRQIVLTKSKQDVKKMETRRKQPRYRNLLKEKM